MAYEALLAAHPRVRSCSCSTLHPVWPGEANAVPLRKHLITFVALCAVSDPRHQSETAMHYNESAVGQP